uniref:hypothetical protein n=1 Tax=Cellvibrio fontiphilus TaxID=1815559 RepID=UPI002B4BC312|nr:hypothetical protein [Cellvibrio fontiphilus]
MTQEIEIQALLKKLAVPAQDLAQLSFCRGTKEAQVKEWLHSLPMTQVQQVSAQLYQAVQEIGRVNTTAESRLAMLELLRTPLHHTLDGLARKYLNQPLILPEAALKTATIAQAMQKHFLNGYLVLVRQLCQSQAPKREQQELQALVISRALVALGLLMLRSYQLYLPIAGQVWSEVHALYQIACALDVARLPVEDLLPQQQQLKTIHNRYLRILLLASARPNQLRQNEIENTYKLLETLAATAELDDYTPKNQENLYVVLTNSNRPPFYKSHWRPSAITDTAAALELRTQPVIQALDDLAKSAAESQDQHKLLPLSAALLNHLQQAWSHLALRSFERQIVSAEIEVTVGLSNIHFHLAGEQAFNLFLNRSSGVAAGEKGDIFQKRGVQLKKIAVINNDDPWGDAFDVSGTRLEGAGLSTLNIEKKLLEREKVDYQGQHPIYKVPLVDRSPGGYGLEWRSEIPLQVRAGELLALREAGRNKWCIGVVRWAHQIKGATQLGIQIMAPHATPVAIAIVHKTGALSEYLRALQIPELRAINQPASLITNAVSFHEYNKARLYRKPQADGRDNKDMSIQLTQRLFGTGAFSQFAFRELMSTSGETSKAQDDFNSVWE